MPDPGSGALPRDGGVTKGRTQDMGDFLPSQYLPVNFEGTAVLSSSRGYTYGGPIRRLLVFRERLLNLERRHLELGTVSPTPTIKEGVGSVAEQRNSTKTVRKAIGWR